MAPSAVSPVISILTHWIWDNPYFSPIYNTIKKLYSELYFCVINILLFKHEQIVCHLLSQPVVHIREGSSYHHIPPESNPPTSNKFQLSTSISEITDNPHVTTSLCFPIWIFSIHHKLLTPQTLHCSDNSILRLQKFPPCSPTFWGNRLTKWRSTRGREGKFAQGVRVFKGPSSNRASASWLVSCPPPRTTTISGATNKH